MHSGNNQITLLSREHETPTAPFMSSLNKGK